MNGTSPERVVIMGAAGRDFHDYNVVFRDDPGTRVIAFTQAGGQNLAEAGTGHGEYPAALCGPQEPDGIPIEPEADLERIVTTADVDRVVFSYSDVSHEHVMHRASRALAAGADFGFVGPDRMMLDLDVPVLAVDAVRTGCGKSQLSRALGVELRDRGFEVAVVREPMPYGDLEANRVQRFASMADIDAADVTLEEREEYEQHVEVGNVVYAGVDYEAIFEAATASADVLVWDGGNNELPFARPDAHFVLADPLRAGAETRYHPGETNLRMADVVVINKCNAAAEADIDAVETAVQATNPDATRYRADSIVEVDEPGRIRGRDVLVVEDGPTVTHGDASYGAGTIAADAHDANRLDPRGQAVGSLATLLDEYDHLDRILPAMGYSERQLSDLAATIEAIDPAVVVAGTPIDLARIIDVSAPVVRAHYHIELQGLTIGDLLDAHAGFLNESLNT